MSNIFSTIDFVIFIGSLVVVMAVGLWAGRKEETSEDFYLAGRSTRWWGVAASIFGSNVSANHLVGMMGVGYALGFAQSHFEITAIAGLLLLCYAFLPVYRKLRVFTLSEYLARRYNESSRLAYALIMIIIMVVIQMVPGFYIGSRSVITLLQDAETATGKAIVGADGSISSIDIQRSGANYATPPKLIIKTEEKDKDGKEKNLSIGTTQIANGEVTGVTITAPGSGFDPGNPPNISFQGGSELDSNQSPGAVVDPYWYKLGIILLAIITGTYTIFGGLKAVIVTDVIQSILLLVGGLIVAFVTFSQPEVGGWAGMIAQDSAEGAGRKMGLYNPMNHADLPWTGVLSGLMLLHFYYWGTNQFIVQRALSARSDREAKLGILAAGFFKLLIPFFSIGTGIAAYYLFRERDLVVAQDVVFPVLLRELIAPIGFGLVGLISAGVIGAILSSLDSMMNSAATIFTFDVYKRFVRPDASEKHLILVGRLCIVAFIVGAATLTMFTMDPNSEESFFLKVASHQAKLITGVVVSFILGMLWRGATGWGAFASIVSGVILSYSIPVVYESVLVPEGTAGGFLFDHFGARLNFMHAAFVSGILSAIVHIVVSLNTSVTEEQAALTWTGLGIFSPSRLRRCFFGLTASLVVYGIFALLVYTDIVPATLAGWATAGWTFCVFLMTAFGAIQRDPDRSFSAGTLLGEDRFWAGLLASTAIFMMYYFV